MTNTFTRFIGDVAATARPQALAGFDPTVLLGTFLNRLMDCLFNRVNSPGAVRRAIAYPEDEDAEPLVLQANATFLEKAASLKSRLDHVKSGRRIHVNSYGGYRPAAVRQGIKQLSIVAHQQQRSLSQDELRDYVIASFDRADAMGVDELAIVLEDEARAAAG